MFNPYFELSTERVWSGSCPNKFPSFTIIMHSEGLYANCSLSNRRLVKNGHPIVRYGGFREDDEAEGGNAALSMNSVNISEEFPLLSIDKT